MRTIKFRGFGAGKWRYGYYVHFDERPLLSVIYNPKFRDFIISQDKYGEHAIPVDPETVGQFTGLLDKNNKPIYEGDIVKDERGKVGYIGWLQQECGFVIVWEKSDSRLGHRARGSGYKYDLSLEVIGNIYDNKEQTQTIIQ